MTNVLIVEDQAMPMELLQLVVNSSERYHVLHSTTNAAMAPVFCSTGDVELVLMDVCTDADSSGLDAAEIIKSKFPQIKIIIVTSIPEFSWLERARRIGADSFWYKTASTELLSIMDRTMEGEHIYPDTTPRVQIGRAANHDLTRRELQILRELTTGGSNTDIGKTLGISEYTVKNHVQNLLKKTGFTNRIELAAQARRLGIVISERRN